MAKAKLKNWTLSPCNLSCNHWSNIKVMLRRQVNPSFGILEFTRFLNRKLNHEEKKSRSVIHFVLDLWPYYHCGFRLPDDSNYENRRPGHF